MGKFINGINGPVKGKVGTLIGSSWKGIPYVKGPYKKRTKRISKDEKANRSKFGLSQFWLHPILDFMREGFRGYSPTVEGFLAAKSWLLKNAIKEDKDGFSVDPALMRVSFGD